MLTFRQFIFENEDDHSKLLKHYNSYTSDHVKHLDDYQEGSEVNTYLHNRHTKPQHTPKNKNFENVVKHLDSATHVHTTPHELTVHRGLPSNPHSGIHQPPGYISTTTNHEVAKRFAMERPSQHKHILTIHIPKGHHGAYVNNPRYGHEQNNSMHEFILPRKTKLKIHPNPTISTHPDPHNPDKHVTLNRWHATIEK